MASKSKSRRRVFRASCILAALIVAGSSFAWFTSKDEVTNRLSATADYDVAIAEDFTPPEKWVPGQKINKDVAVTNTGNIDAFARMRLSGEMRILQTTAAESTTLTADNWTTSAGQFASTTTALFGNNTANDVEDPELIKMGLTKYYAATDTTGEVDPRYYFKMLSKTSTENPEDNQQSNKQDDYNNENNTDYYSEVQAMQAGGILAYAPSGAEYTYVLNQETELPIYSTDGEATPKKSSVVRKVPAGTRVYVTNTAVTHNDAVNWLVNTTTDMSNVNTVWVAAQTYTGNGGDNSSHFNPVIVDADSFQPLTPGTYLFARNTDLDGTVTKPNNYEFSGYYYSDYDTVITDANGTTSMTHTAKNAAVAAAQLTTNGGNKWVDGDGKISKANGNYGEGTYYALKNENDLKSGDNRSDYTVPNGKTGDDGATDPVKAVTVTELDNDLWYIAPTNNLELYTAAYNKIDASGLKFRTAGDAATDVAGNTIYAIYDKAITGSASDDQAFDKDDDIVIEIGLTNIEATSSNAKKWTAISDQTNKTTSYTMPYATSVDACWDATNLTFYYNDDIESGDTTEKLVDYVKLSELVTNKAYLAFDFDLNVFMDSIQVTYEEDGKESDTPVDTKWDVDGAGTAAKGTDTHASDVNEITLESWVKA